MIQNRINEHDILTYPYVYVSIFAAATPQIPGGLKMCADLSNRNCKRNGLRHSRQTGIFFAAKGPTLPRPTSSQAQEGTGQS
jgi:hypothetical protein